MEAVWDGHTDARVAFMIAGALDFYRCAIEKKAPLGIESDGSETEGVGHLVDHLILNQNGCADRIENRMLAGPQVHGWDLHRDLLFRLACS